MIGFTGVRWETRQAERLSRDLSAGAGPKPLFEAGLAWSAVATSLSELEKEIVHLRKSVVEGWSGDSLAGVLAALDSLHAWVRDTGDMATRTAQAAERQAIAHTVAVAAMPDAAVIEGVAQIEAAIKMVAAPPSALISGSLARLDDQAVSMKAQASRVMESYEQATTPVSKPTVPPHAPSNAAKQHLARQSREEAEAKLAAANGSALMAAQAAMLGAMTRPTGTLRASDQYVTQTRRAQTVVEVTAAQEAATAERTTVASTAAGSTPFVPAAGASASGSQGTSSPVVASTNYDSVQDVVPATSATAAPSVIGEAEREGS
ncbi:PPE domain-containing protein [Williamsia sp. M5A3_1d]